MLVSQPTMFFLQRNCLLLGLIGRIGIVTSTYCLVRYCELFRNISCDDFIRRFSVSLTVRWREGRCSYPRLFSKMNLPLKCTHFHILPLGSPHSWMPHTYWCSALSHPPARKHTLKILVSYITFLYLICLNACAVQY